MLKRFSILLITLLLPLSAAAQTVAIDVADLVENLMPAVVNISTTQKMPERRQLMGFPPEFQQFFEQFGLPHGGTPYGMEDEDAPLQRRQATALGSGFIIDPKGYVVTNSHVIDGADEITVTLSNETQLKAKIIGTDKRTDLALLKIEGKQDFPFVVFGDSDKSRVGEMVIAIGNPFGLGGTVTTGIISATNRNINAGPFDSFIQTDAAINKGNSGGPMFNAKGEVIGINTAIFSTGGGSIGIGFATPSSLARPVVEQLKGSGRVKRAFLGVSLRDVTEEMAESLDIEKDRGVAVAEVSEGGPAHKAGMQVSDIIMSFDGKAVTRTKRLPSLVAEAPVGKQVTLEVFRQGKTVTLRPVLGEMKPDEGREDTKLSDKAEQNHKEEGIKETATINGMIVGTIDAAVRDKFQFGKDTKGLVILGIKRNSPLSLTGLKRSDIITAINQQVVETAAAAKQIVQQAEKENRQHILLTVKRQNQTILLTVPLK